MKIQFAQKEVPFVLSEIAAAMGTEVLKDYSVFEVLIPPKFGSGKISGFKYDGVSMLLFNCTFKKDLELEFLESTYRPLRLNYCLKGGFRHAFNHGKLSYQLEKFTGSITACSNPLPECFCFPAAVPLVSTHIQIDRKEYYPRVESDLMELPFPLQETFEDLEGEDTFFYSSNFNIGIVDCIQSFYQNVMMGLVESIFMEGKILELLSLQLKQYVNDYHFPVQKELLSKNDTEHLLKARDILVHDLSKNITIPQLAKFAGLNQQKLKTGFKIIFNKTIAKYLRDERLEKARQLLATGTMTVRETAEHVGYANQSHFARRFNEKFKMLPREFLNSCRDN